MIDYPSEDSLQRLTRQGGASSTPHAPHNSTVLYTCLITVATLSTDTIVVGEIYLNRVKEWNAQCSLSA